ncbi:MAG: metallopeptidase family protein [Pseudolabrys sp.]
MSPSHERHRPSGPHGHHPAPSLADFEAMAARAFARLPATFRALCEDLVIRVDEFPSPEVLAHMALSSPYDLLGLFQGIGLPFRPETGVSGLMPNMIWLYRRPILAYWRQDSVHGGDSLEAIVTHVLVHEIGHHFGFSDGDMDAIEAQAD